MLYYWLEREGDLLLEGPTEWFFCAFVLFLVRYETLLRYTDH